MEISALYPTRDIGTDPARIRDWAQAAEDLGFSHIEVPDHVFGATARDGWTPRYNEQDPFHETFVTLGFLAAVTRTIRLTSGVLILPQRQTGLVAKQAAEVDVLCEGRLRLGVGVGWNFVEYQALGTDWKTRGARQAEQIEVLKRLWTDDLVTFKGRFHDLYEVNITPPPVQRPIPIWFGGDSEPVIRRAARYGDGWMPILTPDEQAESKLAMLREQLTTFGRDPEAFGIEGWLRMYEADPDQWAAGVEGWRRLGADIVMLYPMYRTPDLDEQIETLRKFKEVVNG
ncbi:MAG TPA: LLM class F420-dependent oxidoreductase [Arenicellales bacterium]|jgi:probable F420-dependent oxidoreductase|nr:LLM class F420-dependent oxidoreductase [Acidobacteriota bacterium]MDP6138449.1 LLM class F420-dependent oxidoreductase [Arenicellales bacterium]MDP7219824.1 LLM class F420-dependent oxidoreductase [Arenicellales bacterium]HJP11626.1 LLM class F420-dependent oxidoreductase [Arenicellales bacterium]|tara:strand:- start:26535 stop:27392 length:858 start_codon:yes stop_codon:yes gene_type:complete